MVEKDFQLVYNMNYNDIVKTFHFKRNHFFEIKDHLYSVQKNCEGEKKILATNILKQINLLLLKTTKMLNISDLPLNTQKEILKFVFVNEEQ